MSSDVVPPTALVDELGDADWPDVVERHTAVVSTTASTRGGIADNFLGDGSMVVFEHAADAEPCLVHVVDPGEFVAAAVGHPTLRLVRIAIGDWQLNGLRPGEYRRL